MEMDDLAIIREILAVTHVPVVAQLQWEKLQALLRSVCDRLTAHTLRLEKAEELAKHFEAFKEETREFCRNTAKECKEFTELEVQKQAEKLETHVKSTGNRLQALQKGMEENAAHITQVASDLTALSGVVGPIPKRLDDLEEGAKATNAMTTQLQEKVTEQDEAIQKQSENFNAQFEQHVMETTGAVRVLTQEIESLQADVLEHSERLQKMEAQAEDVKLELQNTAATHASELANLNRYCQALRTDIDTKLVAPPELKPGQRRPSAIVQDLGNAVSDMQGRLQAKADAAALDQASQANKDAVQRLAAVVDDLRHQMKRTSTAAAPPLSSRRSSKLSSLLAAGGTKGMVTDYVADEVRETLKTHERLLDEVHRDMGYLGKGLIILSGHDRNYTRAFLPEEPPPAPSDVPPGSNAPAEAPAASGLAASAAAPPISGSAPAPASSAPVPVPEPSYEDLFFSFEKALRLRQIQPKENTAEMKQLQTVLASLKDTKAEKKDMQKLARIVREFMEQPEHAVFTGKPLVGFKCMSCDQDIGKLNPLRADFIATKSMRKQLPAMMAAERLYGPSGSPRTPRLSSQRSQRSLNSGPLTPRLTRSAGNPNTLSKPL